MPQPRSWAPGGSGGKVLLNLASWHCYCWVIGLALFWVAVGDCSFHEPSKCCLLGNSYSFGTSLSLSNPSLLLPLESKTPLLKQWLVQKGGMKAVVWLVQMICPFQGDDTWEMRMWGAEGSGWVKNARWWKGVKLEIQLRFAGPLKEKLYWEHYLWDLLPNPSRFNARKIKNYCLLPIP